MPSSLDESFGARGPPLPPPGFLNMVHPPSAPAVWREQSSPPDQAQEQPPSPLLPPPPPPPILPPPPRPLQNSERGQLGNHMDTSSSQRRRRRMDSQTEGAPAERRTRLESTGDAVPGPSNSGTQELRRSARLNTLDNQQPGPSNAHMHNEPLPVQRHVIVMHGSEHHDQQANDQPTTSARTSRRKAIPNRHHHSPVRENVLTVPPPLYHPHAPLLRDPVLANPAEPMAHHQQQGVIMNHHLHQMQHRLDYDPFGGQWARPQQQVPDLQQLLGEQHVDDDDIVMPQGDHRQGMLDDQNHPPQGAPMVLPGMENLAAHFIGPQNPPMLGFPQHHGIFDHQHQMRLNHHQFYAPLPMPTMPMGGYHGGYNMGNMFGQPYFPAFQLPMNMHPQQNNMFNQGINGMPMFQQHAQPPLMLNPPPQPPVIQGPQNPMPVVQQQPVITQAGPPPPYTPRQRQGAAVIPSLVNIAPRVQQLIASNRPEHRVQFQNILENLQCDELWKQRLALQELSHTLLMGNEDTLPTGVPTKEIVKIMNAILSKEKNPEMMNLAAECLRNLLEALPRSHSAVVESIPHLIERLHRMKHLDCVDVGENALIPLATLSKRYGKIILEHGGMAAALLHVDFFTTPAQHNSFVIAANCAPHVDNEDFDQVLAVLPTLIERLTDSDSKIVDQVCVALGSIVQNVVHRKDYLRSIAQDSLVYKVPIVISSMNLKAGTKETFLRMLRILMHECDSFSVELMKIGFAEQLQKLFAGVNSASIKGHLNIVELKEILYMSGEMFPRLPSVGVFRIDPLLLTAATEFQPMWGIQKDSSEVFKVLSIKDIAKINKAIIANEQEVNFEDFDVILRPGEQPMKFCLVTADSTPLVNQPGRPLTREKDSRDTFFGNGCFDSSEIVKVIVPQLITFGISITDHYIQFQVLRVLLRLILPCNSSVFADGFPFKMWNLKGLLHKSLTWNHKEAFESDQLFSSVTAIQLIRTLIEKDASNIVQRFILEQGIYSDLSNLSEVIESAASDYDKLHPAPAKRRITRSVAKQKAAERRSNSGGKPSRKRTLDRERELELENAPEEARPERDMCWYSHFFPKKSEEDVEKTAMETDREDADMPPDLKTRDLSDLEFRQVLRWMEGEIEAINKHFPDQLINKFTGLIRQIGETSDKLGMTGSLRMGGRQHNESNPKNILQQVVHILDSEFDPAVVMWKRGLFEQLVKYLDSAADESDMTHIQQFCEVFIGLEQNAHDICQERAVPFEKLIQAVVKCIDHYEGFQVNLYESMSEIGETEALAFFRNHPIKIHLKPHPGTVLHLVSIDGSHTIKLDALLTVQQLLTYTSGKARPRDNMDGDSYAVMANRTPYSFIYDSQTCNVPLDPRLVLFNHIMKKNPTVCLDHLLNVQLELYYKTTPEVHDFDVVRMSTYDPEKALNDANADSIVKLLGNNTELKSRYARDCTAFGTEIDPTKQTRKRFIGKGEEIFGELQAAHALLKFLSRINEYWMYIHQGKWYVNPKVILSKETFHSETITLKVRRQLDNFYTILFNDIPGWLKTVAHTSGILLPFELRQVMFNLLSYDRDRALAYWMSIRGYAIDESPQIARIKKTVITVKRQEILTTALDAFKAAPSSSYHEFNFFGEEGTGPGPTQEFYSLLCKEFRRADLKLFFPHKIEKDPVSGNEYISNDGPGLYFMPCSNKQANKQRYKQCELLGTMMAQALLDGKRLDLVLSPAISKALVQQLDYNPMTPEGSYFDHGNSEIIGHSDMIHMDPVFYRSVMDMVMAPKEELDAICAPFIFPNVEGSLVPSHKHEEIDANNINEYLEHLKKVYVRSTMRQIDYFILGFKKRIGRLYMSLFSADEMEQLFCGRRNSDATIWNKEHIMESLKFELGYTRDSQPVLHFVEMLCSFSPEDRSQFLQFATGSPRLPYGGFAALNPPLKVVCKVSSKDSTAQDNEFPTAVTCRNYIKLPAYSTYEVMRSRFMVALKELSGFDFT